MQKKIENYLEEIEKQKELNAQHETEIETLLKFNERLLGIIENELSNNRKERVSLQPISERSERESDLNIGPMHSFIKARKFGPKSERGSLTSNSLI
jgi:ATP-dependent helicase/DNAse subunit B